MELGVSQERVRGLEELVGILQAQVAFKWGWYAYFIKSCGTEHQRYRNAIQTRPPVVELLRARLRSAVRPDG